MAVLFVGFVLTTSNLAWSQQAPEVGYVFPPGASAGQTVTVRLSGYDWTPDMEFFVLDKRVKLEIVGKPGPMLIPRPPYWFGPKARGPAMLIPREVVAKMTIPADMPAGPIAWQAANANGATSKGTFVIGGGPELNEIESQNEPIVLKQLPVTINGRLGKIEEVDRYQFTADRTGPITFEVFTRQIGSPVNAVLRVLDAKGRLVTDAVDTQGIDLALTFHANANETYTLQLHDMDFRGNASHVYRLTVTPGPRVVAAIPAAGKRGSKANVTFIGYGLATGLVSSNAKLESVTAIVGFPSDETHSHFDYTLKTKHGNASPFRFSLSDLNETTESNVADESFTVPTAVTGVLAKRGEVDRYRIKAIKGETLDVHLHATAAEQPLDTSLAIVDSTGKQIATNDDANGSTDSHLVFTPKIDGDFELVVSDIASRSGRADSTYRLAVTRATPNFTLVVPDRLSLPIGGKFGLKIIAARGDGFAEPIELAFEDLPAGVAQAAATIIAPKKNDATITLTAADESSSRAFFATLVATAKSGDKIISQRHRILVARTMSPRATVTPVDKDGGRTVHRGTTYPAEVIVTRAEGFTGPVTLQMAAKQGRHRQGIDGDDVVVPPSVTRTVFPVYCPEWLETDRTSRMVVNAITEIRDPKGEIRYLSSKMDGRITMSLEGALLKIASPRKGRVVRPGEPFAVPITVSRSPKLAQTVTLSLHPDSDSQGEFLAESVNVPAGQTQAVFNVTVLKNTRLRGTHQFTVRGVAMQDGKYPAVSQTIVSVDIADGE